MDLDGAGAGGSTITVATVVDRTRSACMVHDGLHDVGVVVLLQLAETRLLIVRGHTSDATFVLLFRDIVRVVTAVAATHFRRYKSGNAALTL